AFNDLRRFRRNEPALGLALKLRFADEHRNETRAGVHHVLLRDDGGLLVVAELRVGTEALCDCRAEAGFVKAAVWRVDSVAIGTEEAVGFAEAIAHPGNRPLDARSEERRVGKESSVQWLPRLDDEAVY